MTQLPLTLEADPGPPPGPDLTPGGPVRVRLWTGDRAEGVVSHRVEPGRPIFVRIDSGPEWAVGDPVGFFQWGVEAADG